MVQKATIRHNRYTMVNFWKDNKQCRTQKRASKKSEYKLQASLQRMSSEFQAFLE